MLNFPYLLPELDLLALESLPSGQIAEGIGERPPIKLSHHIQGHLNNLLSPRGHIIDLMIKTMRDYPSLAKVRRRQWHPTPVLLLGNPMDGGAWQAAVHGVSKSCTRLRDFTSTFHFHALEKEMATHSSVLAWRIPGTGEPGGLPSMGSHRVGHD